MFYRIRKLLKNIKAKFTKDSLTVTFHMAGGHAVVVTGVTQIKTTSNGEGKFDSYSITWKTGCKPAFFSLSVPAIEAITAK